MRNYLRAYINYAQDNWLDFLPDAQFAANNHVNETTEMTPFFANHGYHPRTGAEPPGSFDTADHPDILAADKLVKQTEDMQEWLKDHIAWTQESHINYANRHRQPHPEYRVGDRVYVDARHFNLQRESQKLSPRALGPWPIVRCIDSKAYEVSLPEHMARAGVTPVFHPWKLLLAPENAYPGQIETPEPPYQIFDTDETEAHNEWEVDKIVDCCEIRGNIQYKALYYGPWDDWNSDPPW
jgi:hypothetical protein